MIEISKRNCKEKEIILIEDNAEDSLLKSNKLTGSYGEMSIFLFLPSMSTIEGGMVITNDFTIEML